MHQGMEIARVQHPLGVVPVCAKGLRDVFTSDGGPLLIAPPAELAGRVGGLAAEVEWAHMLSLGEQQRVAMARLLLHRPSLAFLDEATSALDLATESRLYATMRTCCDCYVSVGKSPPRSRSLGHNTTAGTAWC